MVYDPASQAAGAYALSGGWSGSSDGRNQRELEDRRAQINGQEGVDQRILDLINNPYNADATGDQLINRYGSVNEAGGSDAANFVRQIYGDQDRLNQFAYDSFVSTYGRPPTANEFTQALPYFAGVNGKQTGAAYLAQSFDQYKKSPEYLKTQSGQYGSQISQIFQDTYGRAPTEAELQHFGTQLAGGQDTYQLGNELKNTQEYQQAQDKTFRGSLASELEGYDTSFFNKAKDSVLSQFSRNGGGAGTSSALDFALTDLMGQIAEKRGSYLSGLSAQQYGGNKDLALGNYRNEQNRYWDDQNYNRARADQNNDYFRSRSDQNSDFLTQQQSYYDQIGRQNQSRGVLHPNDWLNLGMQGVNAYAQSQSGNRTTNNYGYLDY